MNASVRECKKVTVLFFRENMKIGHFGPRLSKIGHFERKWSKMTKIEDFPHFLENRILDVPNFWSLDEVVGDLRSHVRSFVRASRVFSETVHYFFLKLYS